MQRQKLLHSLCSCAYPIIFYESPRRIEGLLAQLLELFGDRHALWAREITKSYEDLRSAKLSELVDETRIQPIKGEFVLIIHPGEKEEVQGETLEELLLWYRDNSDLSLKDVSKKLSADLGLSKSAVYQKALSLWNNQ